IRSVSDTRAKQSYNLYLSFFKTCDESSDYAKDYVALNIEEYTSRINVVVVNESEDRLALEFDLIHIEAPVANALRRILIAEVPSMAIEKVYLYQNTSIIQDEVLCHRLGLLPVNADPRMFDFPSEKSASTNELGTDCDEEPAGDPKRNLIFEINVKCTRKRNCPTIATEPILIYDNSVVYTNSFKWVPIANQETVLRPPPKMVHDDILLAKLRPGQQIEARCHCIKGCGRDHAKFSPVATATYRILPDIKLKKQFSGDDAERIKSSFSEGVIGIDSGGFAFVQDARRDACNRNIFRYEDLAKNIELTRRKGHFIFSVESTGALKSSDLVIEACKIMEEKCRYLSDLFERKIKLTKKQAVFKARKIKLKE
ncbi:unnamed protein product, partial [Dracunculus medinensis]|uniref:DNA-directed RNA polymerases I and III subunit RPAC1 n=1 Tax=Dracunculus medinensis TaxID=318479 RepID=A0A0N4UPD3_DRAME